MTPITYKVLKSTDPETPLVSGRKYTMQFDPAQNCFVIVDDHGINRHERRKNAKLRRGQPAKPVTTVQIN